MFKTYKVARRITVLPHQETRISIANLHRAHRVRHCQLSPRLSGLLPSLLRRLLYTPILWAFIFRIDLLPYVYWLFVFSIIIVLELLFFFLYWRFISLCSFPLILSEQVMKSQSLTFICLCWTYLHTVFNFSILLWNRGDYLFSRWGNWGHTEIKEHAYILNWGNWNSNFSF